jgi:hypothetical protein
VVHVKEVGIAVSLYAIGTEVHLLGEFLIIEVHQIDSHLSKVSSHSTVALPVIYLLDENLILAEAKLHTLVI